MKYNPDELKKRNRNATDSFGTIGCGYCLEMFSHEQLMLYQLNFMECKEKISRYPNLKRILNFEQDKENAITEFEYLPKEYWNCVLVFLAELGYYPQSPTLKYVMKKSAINELPKGYWVNRLYYLVSHGHCEQSPDVGEAKEKLGIVDSAMTYCVSLYGMLTYDAVKVHTHVILARANDSQMLELYSPSYIVKLRKKSTFSELSRELLSKKTKCLVGREYRRTSSKHTNRKNWK